jgi:hypothetical protein
VREADVEVPKVRVGSVAVTGTATVGSTLRAQVNDVLPTGTSTRITWMRGAPTAMDDSIGSGVEYKVQSKDAGEYLQVRVVATVDGVEHAARSQVMWVSPHKKTPAIASVAIAGSATVGSTLTAKLGTITPTGAKVRYTWLKDSETMWDVVDSKYVVTPDDIGYQIWVVAQVSADGYDTTGFASAMTQRVSAPTVQPTVTQPTALPQVKYTSVSVSGTAAPGAKLTGSVSGLTPSDATQTYKWSYDGGKTTVFTGQTFTLPSDYKGQAIDVTFCATKTGYQPSPCTIKSVPVPTAKFTSMTLSSPTEAGSKVTVTLNGLTPSWAAKTFTWKVAGQTMQTGSSDSYTLPSDSAGKQLQVTATVSTASSSPYGLTTVVYPITAPLKIGSVTISGTVATGRTLTATATGVVPTNATLTYQWYVGGSRISGATGKTFVVRGTDAGQTVKVQVSATSGGKSVSLTSASTVAVPTPGVIGYLSPSSSNSVVGYRVHYDNYVCGGLDLRTPADDYGDFTSVDNNFAVGRFSSGDCYRIWIYSPSGTLMKLSWNGKTGQYLDIPAGSKNVTLTLS